MKSAKSLRDLFKIRDQNHSYLNSISNGGTVLGRKNGDGDPAIVVFVNRKINRNWLPADMAFSPKLAYRNSNDVIEIECPLDVVQTEGFDFQRPVSQVQNSNLTLLEELRGTSPTLRPGSQLAFWDKEGYGFSGTLGCIARRRNSNDIGFITNQHVGDYHGNVMKHPEWDSRAIAIVQRTIQEISDADRFPDLGLNEEGATYLIDAQFSKFLPDLVPSIDFSSDPRIALNNKIETIQLGAPLELDLDSMDSIGLEVIGVGRTRGTQEGTIVGVSFEHRDGGNFKESWPQYSDYLIANKRTSEFEQSFSSPGDSGKLIFSNDGAYRPIALLWGGGIDRLRNGMNNEDWSMATSIDFIMDSLDVELFKTS